MNKFSRDLVQGMQQAPKRFFTARAGCRLVYSRGTESRTAMARRRLAGQTRAIIRRAGWQPRTE
jgi:hypothetical protein